MSAVNQKSKRKTLTFTANYNFRKGAYLALTVNKTKGVMSYKKVKKSEINAEIIKELN
ncbi:hypothetical protein Hs30E_05170 [Lactococcus hodotermopsidis]|uniref:Uncharacterized protein n=1 Tax=Pseudolactococcus hodotermopsidis TaxID=2709157 RepID=A0A6A0BAX2_9LACT|nr:hypothetical protein Hs30E_05170 [Lactococcus hodotermopsidis]